MFAIKKKMALWLIKSCYSIYFWKDILSCNNNWQTKKKRQNQVCNNHDKEKVKASKIASSEEINHKTHRVPMEKYKESEDTNDKKNN